MYKDFNEGIAALAADRPRLEELGVHLTAISYTPDGVKMNYDRAEAMAMDAQPGLFTTPSGSVPWALTNLIDPDLVRILFAPNNGAKILTERKKGDWLMDTAQFPVIEATGEVSSYGDYSNNGSTSVNTNWPSRANYLFQTIEQYGERELERAALGKINWVSEIDASAATVIGKFMNLSYFFGIGGLQNYGMTNDPNLSAALTPALKAYGGTKWIENGVLKATANEVYNDIVTLYGQLVAQSQGIIDQETPIVLTLPPGSNVAMTATNSFNVNVTDLLKKNFPNIRIETAVQFGQTSASNPQGIAAGNFMQMVAPTLEGMDTGYCAFSEKFRQHKLVADLSAWKKKVTAGTWGAVIRVPLAFAQMVGI